MGVDCYCNKNSEQGNIPVPPLDKTVDVSNNKENYDKYNFQETYKRIFTINKNELKTVLSNKNENDNINNNLENQNDNIENQNDKIENQNDNNNQNQNDNNSNSDNNINEDKSNLDFDKNINIYSTQITEEKLNSQLNTKIKEIESKLGEISQNIKDDYIYKKDKKIIFKSPLLFKEANYTYFGSWDPTSYQKEGWGILIDKEGNKYEGGWEKDIIDGYGRIISVNGNYYEGEIKKGIIEGKGMFYSEEKKMLYKGDFKNNLFEGKGEQNFENKKIIYEGTFKNGKKDGKGKLILEGGNIYEGDFSEDKYNGDGCFKWKDGREYKGKWKDNQMCGKGVFKWDKNIWFEGEYKDNRREGFGIYHFNKIDYFEGKWINNLPHGEGKLIMEGKIIEGLFRFGKIIKNKNNKKGKKSDGNIFNKINFKDENIDVNYSNKKRTSFK